MDSPFRSTWFHRCHGRRDAATVGGMEWLSDLAHRLMWESGFVGPLLLGFVALCVLALVGWLALALVNGTASASSAFKRGWDKGGD